MRIRVAGGGWVSSTGWGRAGQGFPGPPDAAPPRLPRGRDIFERPPARFGRFDRYTRSGLAAIALALADAGLEASDTKRPIGLVASSLAGCLETDLAFQQSAREAGGAYASPNLFSYTLPGIVLGEAALHFGLTGPTLALGDRPGQPGAAALETALALLAARACPTLLAGWIEARPESPVGDPDIDRAPQGSLFVLLDTAPGPGPALTLAPDGPRLDNGAGVPDLPALLARLGGD